MTHHINTCRCHDNCTCSCCNPAPKKILFILKFRYNYGDAERLIHSSGLKNSAGFVKDMLLRLGYDVKLVEVVDANAINREVTLFRPDVVVIEALWVPVAKMIQLQNIHKTVQWLIRIHSEIPFLANEGIAMERITGYLPIKNVYLAPNSKEAHDDIRTYMKNISPAQAAKVLFLPNFYPVTIKRDGEPFHKHSPIINIACFGSPRPMKNQLNQAFAAVRFAEEHGYRLRFHINADRKDNGEAGSVLKNIIDMFEALPKDRFHLIQHKWMSHEEFTKVISRMDLGMQVSMSETFNIVTADFINQLIPIVVSPDISWMPSWFYASSTEVDSMVKAMNRVLFYDIFGLRVFLAKWDLRKYSDTSKNIWKNTIEALTH